MAFSNPWDNAAPADTQAASQGAADFRSLKVDVQQRMATISGLDAAKQNFEAGFAGVVYFATDTNRMYQWSGAAWVDITNSIYGRQVSFSVNAGTLVGMGNITIPANLMAVGKRINIKCILAFGAGAAAGYLRLSIGGVLLGQISTPTAANRARLFEFDVYITGAATQVAIGKTSLLNAASSGSNSLEVGYTTSYASVTPINWDITTPLVIEPSSTNGDEVLSQGIMIVSVI